MSGTISMETEQAIQVASTLNQNARLLDELSLELSSKINRLEISWQGGASREYFFIETTHLKSRLTTVTRDLFELYNRLIYEIREWETADSKFGTGKKAVNNAKVGNLFVIGEGDFTIIHPNDVYQGNTGDCYLMASLAALAATNPDMIREMITVNADGTYTVRFFNEQTGKAEYVTIDPKDIPNKNGNLIYAGYGDNGELWPAIIERAYAEWIDERNIRDSSWSLFLEKLGLEGTNDFKLISGGLPQVALQHLTGANSVTFEPTSFSEADLLQNLMEGNPITLGTLQSDNPIINGNTIYGGNEGQLVPSHAYYITGYDAATGLVEIHNPWGWTSTQGTVYLPLETLQQYIAFISVTDVTP